ncbi:ABC transporter transmembrane domain-containing protein [Corynebacterium suedekumii]|nr:ABC transporter transmembrane domain-containing protein [Corynebacterium suedekumii]
MRILYQAGELKEIVNWPVMMVAYLLGSAVVVGVAHPVLGVLMLAGGVVTTAATLVTAGPLARVAERRRHAEGVAMSQATDLAQGSRVVKGLGAVEGSMGRFHEATQRALDVMLREARLTGWLTLVRQLVPTAAVIIVLVVALVMTRRSAISTADSGHGDPGGAAGVDVAGYSLSFAVDYWARGLVSTQRIRDLVADLEAPAPATGFTAVLAPGLTVWSSTTAAGQEKIRRRLDDLRDSGNPGVVVAPHAVAVFEGSLADNIDPLRDADPERVQAALSAAACGDIITRLGGADGETLPDAPIGEAGSTCPVGSASGWLWRGGWSGTRRCWFSTNRRRAWTR